MMHRHVREFCAAVLLLAGFGCSVPSQPDALPFSTRPLIKTVNTDRAPTVGAPLPVTVLGSNFAHGLTLQVTLPDGSLASFSGDAIQGLDRAQFGVTIPFTQPGTYYFVVQNPDDAISTPFSTDIAP